MGRDEASWLGLDVWRGDCDGEEVGVELDGGTLGLASSSPRTSLFLTAY